MVDNGFYFTVWQKRSNVRQKSAKLLTALKKKDSYFGNNFRLFILVYYYALKITYTVQNIIQLKNIMR